MGSVSLERVQFKFASIIGELCNEPFILSQFAVWLDLRLAEYKLQGAISLECSNERPDPDWLKGVRDIDIQRVGVASAIVPAVCVGGSREIIQHNPHRSKIKVFNKRQMASADYGNVHDMTADFTLHDVHERINPNLPKSVSTSIAASVSTSNSPHQPTIHSTPDVPLESLDDQLSPGVVVKVEPKDGNISIFPAALHSNDDSQNNLASPVRRKRCISATNADSDPQINIINQALFTAENDDLHVSEQSKAAKFSDHLSHSTPFPSREDESMSYPSFISADRESFDIAGASQAADCESLFQGNNSDQTSTALKCCICGTTAPSKPALQEHFETEHTNIVYDCLTCSKRITLDEVPQHQRMQHNTQEALKCPTCFKVFQQKRYLKEHMRKHAAQPERKCVRCGQRFTWRASLNNHLKKCEQGHQMLT